jgi:1-phosphatidylinositol-3-phosphate 5-kinase
MKTLTNLWTGHQANLLPLDYPDCILDQFFPDSIMSVHADDPSSVIAFALGSKWYKDIMRRKSSGSQNFENILDNSDDRHSIDLDDQFVDNEESIKSNGSHVRYQFLDKSNPLYCKIFFAEQFGTLRQNCGIDDSFAKSLSRSIKWHALGGKSGSSFSKTRDDRFVIKQLSRLEMDSLYKFAPKYLEYMSNAFFQEVYFVFSFYSFRPFLQRLWDSIGLALKILQGRL